MADNAKTVIIGLDGVPFGMIKHFAETSVMPNTAEIIRRGVFTKMQSSVPEVSSVAWSSMITGTNPGTHGIFGFMDLAPNSYKMTFPNFSNLRTKPFWEMLSEPAVILNVPATYPVRPMNGVIISGFVSIDINKSVYPASLIPKLKEFDYRLDVNSQKAHTSLDDFIEDIDKTLRGRIAAYRYLWQNQQWSTFMLVFTATDRLMHFLWNAYEDTGNKYHRFFLDHFNKIDAVIGEIAAKLDENDLLIIHSDHGFETLDYDIYINKLLQEKDFLKFNPGIEPDIANIDVGTKAFALDPARIYLNLKAKYPCGSVEPQQAEEILAEIAELFSQFKIDGKNVIKHIYRKHEVYSGPQIENAPDLVLIGAEGFNLKASVKTDSVAGKGIFSGKHTFDTAFLLVQGLKDKALLPRNPAVHHIRQIMEAGRG